MNALRTAKYSEWLASLFGACFVSFGLGAWFGESFSDPLLAVIVVVGIVMHSWGMYRINKRNAEQVR